MKSRALTFVLSVAMLGTPAIFVIGCDKEVAHDKTVKTDSNGNVEKNETTVKEKPDGSVEKTTDKKVEKAPGQ